MNLKSELPRSVYVGLVLFVVSYLIGNLRAMFEVFGLFQIDNTLGIVGSLVWLFLAFLSGFLIYMMYKGKDWARVAFFVLLIVGFFLSVEKMIVWFYFAKYLLVIYLFEVFISLIGLRYIFSEESKNWFKK